MQASCIKGSYDHGRRKPKVAFQTVFTLNTCMMMLSGVRTQTEWFPMRHLTTRRRAQASRKTENFKNWQHFVMFYYEMLLWSAARPWPHRGQASSKTENFKNWQHFVLFYYEMMLWSTARPWACGPRLRIIRKQAPCIKKIINVENILSFLLMKCCSGQQLDPGVADPGSEES